LLCNVAIAKILNTHVFIIAKLALPKLALPNFALPKLVLTNFLLPKLVF